MFQQKHVVFHLVYVPALSSNQEYVVFSIPYPHLSIRFCSQSKNMWFLNFSIILIGSAVKLRICGF